MKRILVPTDFSENAWHALIYMAELFKEDDCDFFLLNAFQPQPYVLDSLMLPEPGEKYYEISKSKSEQGLAQLVQAIKKHQDNPKHTFTAISEIGFPLDCIIGAVAKNDIDLIAMGTKGATGSKFTTFGTNTVSVIKAVHHCPLYAVPRASSFIGFREIVFATDYKTHFKKNLLQPLLDLAETTDAPIRILHIAKANNLNEKQKSNKKLLETCFEGLEYSHHTLRHGSPSDALLNFIESRGSDLIVLVNRKHGFLRSLFVDPTIQDIGYYSTIPFLALPENEK